MLHSPAKAANFSTACRTGVHQEWRATGNAAMRNKAKQEYKPGGRYLLAYLSAGCTSKAGRNACPTCHFGIFGILRIFGIFGIMLLLPEFPRGKIGPEGVCAAQGGRGAGEKSFFCITNPKVPLESTKRWLRFWVRLAKKPPESQAKPFIEGFAMAFRAVCRQV